MNTEQPHKSPQKPKVTPVSEKLPAINETVWVVCKDFRCMGYLDRNQVWRALGNTVRLKEVVGWYPI